MTLEEAIKHCEEIADVCEDNASKYDLTDGFESYMASQDEKCASEHRQLAEWLSELKVYREGINNLIENQSIEVVNPFNTYQYMRVVRVADLYDLMEVNADEED